MLSFFKVILSVVSFMIVLGVLRSAWFKGIAGEALDPKNDLPEIRGFSERNMRMKTAIKHLCIILIY